MKKISVILALLLCLLPLSGCWDKQELEDNTFVVLLGIDAAEDGAVMVTVAFPQTQTEDGSSDEGMNNASGKYSVMSVKAATVAEGLSLFGTKLSGPLALYTVKTIVISREVAQDDMLRQIFSSWRNEELRNTTNVLVSECKAAQFIEARIKNPLIDPLRQEELLLERANGSADYKPIQLLELLTNLKSGRGDGVAMYGTAAAKEDGGEAAGDGGGQGGGEEKSAAEIEEAVGDGYLPGALPVSAENESQIAGLAVFRGAKMVGVLNSQEAQTYAMLMQGDTVKMLTVQDPLDPEYQIVVEILPGGEKRVKSAVSDGVPVFQLDLKLRCTVECIQSEVDYTLPEHYDLLTEQIQKACAENMTSLIDKAQKEFGADIFKLGDQLAHHFRTVYDWERFDWPERYRDAEIRLNVSVTVARAGVMRA